MRPLILLASALILTGCATATAAPEVAEEPTNCVQVNEATQAALQAGIDIPDTTLTGYAAAPSPSTDGLWYIAATYTGLDIDGEAVWIADADPTTATNATYMSVDAVAEAISLHPRIDGGTITAPGAVTATACLN